MEDDKSRKLQRGLKDISELFRGPAESSLCVETSLARVVSLYAPGAPEVSLGMASRLTEVFSARGYGALAFSGGAEVPGGVRVIKKALAAMPAGVSDPLFAVGAADLSLKKAAHSQLLFTDLLILVMDGDVESVKEAYQSFKSVENPPALYALFSEDCPEDKAAFIYEWFSSYLLKKRGLSIEWLGSLAGSPLAGIASRIESLHPSRPADAGRSSFIQALLKKVPQTAAGAAA